MTHRIAVFLPNWIGDAVMAIPTIRALRSYYGPAAHIVGIMKPTIADVFDATPWLNEVWLYSPGEGKWIHRPPALLWRFLRDPFDVSVHLTNDFLSVLLSRLGGTSSCAGYRRRLRGWMLSTGLDAPRAGRRFVPVSALDYYLQIACALGCPIQSPATELCSTERDEAAADRAWRNFGLSADDPVVVVNSGGAFGSAKSWPEDSCASLAVRIAERVDHAVIILCGPAEREMARRTAAKADHPRVFSLADEPVSVGLSKAVIRRSRCLVSTDSGPRHLGAAFNVPVVALFGPTEIAWSDTHYPREIRLQHAVDCGPCGQRECPEGHHKCMRDLSVETVFAAVRSALSGTVP